MTERKKSPPKKSGASVYSDGAEQALLGALMLTGGKGQPSEDAFEILKDSDFYVPSHRIVFNTMKQLLSQRMAIDAITIAELLEQTDGKLDEIGGFAYLSEMAKNTPSSSNMAAYTDIVYQHSNARNIARAAMRAAENIGTGSTQNMAQKISASRAELERALSNTTTLGLFNPLEILAQQMEDIDEDYGHVETIFNEAITHKDLALLTGAGGTGKSYFTIKLAISVALGRPAFSGHEKFLHPTKPGVVVFLIGEDDEKTYRRRLDRIISSQSMSREDKEVILSHVVFASVAAYDTRVVRKSAHGDLEHSEMVTQIARSLKQCGTTMAIFDPMNRFCGVSENDNAEMNIFVAAMRRIADKASCSVLMVHHSAKGDAGGSRGASALVDGVRTHISLVTAEQMKSGMKNVQADPADKDRILVRMVKSNHLPFWKKPFWLERREGGDLFTIPQPDFGGGVNASKYFHVDIVAVRAAVVEYLIDAGMPVDYHALIKDLHQNVVKDICPDERKLSDVIDEMIETEMLGTMSVGGKRRVKVIQKETDGPVF